MRFFISLRFFAAIMVGWSVALSEVRAEVGAEVVKEADYSKALEMLAGRLPALGKDVKFLVNKSYDDGRGGGVVATMLEISDAEGRKKVMYPLGFVHESSDGGGRFQSISYQAHVEKLKKLFSKKWSGSEEWQWKSSGAMFMGNELTMAAVAWQQGHKKEANQVVSIIFKNSRNAEEVIHIAISGLAEYELSIVHGEFTKTGDWAKLGSELKRIRSTYQRGWMGAGGVQLLEQQVAKAVQGDFELQLALDGETFTQEDREKAQQLLKLDAKELDVRLLLDEKAGENSGLGLADLRLMLAMLRSDQLMPWEKMDAAAKENESSYSYENPKKWVFELAAEENLAMRAQKYFMGMKRPVQVKEKAQLLVQALMQGSMEESDSEEHYERNSYSSQGSSDDAAGSLLESVLPIYQSLRGKYGVRRAELLLNYDEARDVALDYLIKHGNAEMQQALVKRVAENPCQQLQVAVELIKKLGPEAAPIYQALLKELEPGFTMKEDEYRAWIQDGDRYEQVMTVFSESWTPKGLKSSVLGLSVFVKKMEFPEMLQAYEKDELSKEALVLAIKKQVKVAGWDAILPQLLKLGVSLADKKDGNMDIYEILFAALPKDAAADADESYHPWEMTSSGKVLVSDIAACAPYWKKLLKQRASTEAGSQNDEWNPRLAASMLFCCYHSALENKYWYMLRSMDAEAESWLLEHALACLAAGEVKPFPVPAVRVAVERKNQLFAEYKSKKVGERVTWATSLPLAEQVVLLGEIHANEALTAQLDEHKPIYAKRTELKSAAKQIKMDDLLGKPVDQEMLETIVERYGKLMAEGRPVRGMVMTGIPYWSGWQTLEREDKISAEQLAYMFDKEEVARIPKDQSYLIIRSALGRSAVIVAGTDESKKFLGNLVKELKNARQSGGFIIIPNVKLSEDARGEKALRKGFGGLKGLFK